MNAWRLVLRSLRFYWRTHLGVLFGAAVSSAVLVGALVVGDSLRHTLRGQVLTRLGDVHLAMHANDRFVRAALAYEISQSLGTPVVPVIHRHGVAARPDATARANRVQVFGINTDFWRLAPSPCHMPKLNDREVILNEAVSVQLGVRVGDHVVLRVEKPSALPRDVPLAADHEASVALHLSIKAIASDEQFGRFSLHVNQGSPFNAFVGLAHLQQVLGLAGKANLLLSGWGAGESHQAREANVALRKRWQMADAELTLREIPDRRVLELRSDRVFLEPTVVRAVENLRTQAMGVVTYFVNELRAGDRSTPYSMVAAVGLLGNPARGVTGLIEPGMRDDQIVVNQWLADDLHADLGTCVQLTSYAMGQSRRLVERTDRFTVRAVVPIAGRAADPNLMPDFPGLSDADNCRDWEPGIPIDLNRIRAKDEAYWNTYRGTPKAFITLAAGRRMWENEFGSLTAVRFRATADLKQCINDAIRNNVDPAELGLSFTDVRDAAAAAPMVDFGVLFLLMSFFLIVAALLLTGLLFAFGAEQRAEEVGTLLALGFGPRRIGWLLLGEGSVLAVVGAGIGVGVGLLYTRALLFALGTVWQGAVGGAALSFHAHWLSLVLGAVSGSMTALLAMLGSLRCQLRRPAWQLLAMGVATDRALLTGKQRKPLRAWWVAGGAVLGAVLLVLIVGSGRGRQAAVSFFGVGALLLVAAISLCAVLLARLASGPAPDHGGMTWCALSVRGCARRSGRSLATIGLLACGSFLIIAINAMRQDPLTDATLRRSGTGGFALWAESAVPIVHDLNSQADREALGLPSTGLGQMHVVSMRLRDGDDASCLTLNRPHGPQLLGVEPEALASRQAFTFVKTIDASQVKNPWLLLRQPQDDGSVPAITDYATLAWALHKKLGQTLTYTDQRGQDFQLRIVGALADSILQGSLVIDQDQLQARYPGEAGFRRFLIDVPAPQTEAVERALSRSLENYGFQPTTTIRRLARFLDVQNTYLSIFQVLGALGVLLGSAGLGAVVLRNLLERRSEFALLRAVGFARGHLWRVTFIEHTMLLALGLASGVAAAAVAVVPVMRSPGTHIPYVLIVVTLGAITFSGVIWVWLATITALRGPLLDALRAE